MAIKAAGRVLVTLGALGLPIVGSAQAQAPFRTSLVAGAYLKSYGGFLQSIIVQWAPSAVEHRYRVQRATALAGPWFTDREFESVVDTLRRLPPDVPLFLRVVALHQVGPERWQGTDTTNVVITATPRSSLFPATAGVGTSVLKPGRITCKQSSPSTISVFWRPIPDASHYRVLPQLRSAPGTMMVNLATIVARDSTITIANLPFGNYRLSIEPQYDITNWPTLGQSLTLYGPAVYEVALTSSAGSVACQ